jgi:hypothetical protein
MNFDWLTWSNPVAIWWGFLVAASALNIVLWLLLTRYLRKRTPNRYGTFRLDLMVWLSAAYVFGCAFRSVLPRADVERICLFDTWLSNVFLGRSVATVAEVCFAAQWAIVLHCLATSAQSSTARTVSNAIVPMIVVAECWSWYAVVTTSYLGNAIENSLWALTFLLIGIALVQLFNRFRGVIQAAIGLAILGILAYVAFMFGIDVPMYFERWQSDVASGKEQLGLLAGLYDASTYWIVTHDIARWQEEIAWMSLYFSWAVWGSLALCGLVLVEADLPRYRVATSRLARRLSARAGAG